MSFTLVSFFRSNTINTHKMRQLVILHVSVSSSLMELAGGYDLFCNRKRKFQIYKIQVVRSSSYFYFEPFSALRQIIKIIVL